MPGAKQWTKFLSESGENEPIMPAGNPIAIDPSDNVFITASIKNHPQVLIMTLLRTLSAASLKR
jgi:hypothetical protein